MKNYTPKQVFIIRNAIERGRQAMAPFDNNATIFAKAFIEANGIQVPSDDIDESTRQRINGYVLKSLVGQTYFAHEPEWLIEVINREIDRIHAEVTQAIIRIQDQVTGLSFAFSNEVADKEFCMKIASTDLYGLGAGIFPKDEIVVLPPGCDQTWWEAVQLHRAA